MRDMTTEERLGKLEKELHQAKRFYRLLVGVVLCLGIVAAAWTFGAQPLLATPGQNPGERSPRQGVYR